MSYAHLKIGIVVSKFNTPITHALEIACLKSLEEAGVLSKNIHLTHVPGAIEIPLILDLLAQKKEFHALIALGAVIRGETTHYDYVCKQVSEGCQHVMLTHSLPVIFGVLTTENEAQALDRAGGAHGNKGSDAAATALEMIQIISNL